MESWVISLLIAIVGIISTFSVLKANVARLNEIIKELEGKIQTLEKAINQNSPVISHLSKKGHDIEEKLIAHAISIMELKEKTEQAPSKEFIRNEFVSKETFSRAEKIIEEKLDAVNKTLNKILDSLEKIR